MLIASGWPLNVSLLCGFCGKCVWVFDGHSCALDAPNLHMCAISFPHCSSLHFIFVIFHKCIFEVVYSIPHI
jgi:hypothetical protein